MSDDPMLRWGFDHEQTPHTATYYVVNRFKTEKLAGHITLTKGERSALAELAANLL